MIDSIERQQPVPAPLDYRRRRIERRLARTGAPTQA